MELMVLKTQFLDERQPSKFMDLLVQLFDIRLASISAMMSVARSRATYFVVFEPWIRPCASR